MRITRLELKAFGPFTDRVLEFKTAGPGLHIVFGPNEAGKSSSLRALKALLYGFPERTPDSFRHAYDQLLVGGRLLADDGQDLYFFRRKKRTADLLDSKGNPMEPAVLSAFLHGVEPEIFETLYGLDHETLVQGGQDILAQKGEVGQALFAAGAGISSLRRILDDLDAEADNLFKARGSKQEINKALAQYKELQRAVKTESLSSREWKEHQQALDDARKKLKSVEARVQEKDRLKRRLERMARAFPHLAMRRELQKQIEALGPVRLLPPDFSEHRRKVEQEIRDAEGQRQRAAERLENLYSRQQSMALRQGLLDQADRIDRIYQRLGEYRKGMQDRPRLEGMRIGLRIEAARLLKQIRPDLSLEQADVLRPVLGKRRAVETLSRQREALVEKADASLRQNQDFESRLKQIEQSLLNLPEAKDPARLLQAVKLSRKLGDMDSSLEARGLEIAAGVQSCAAELKRIGLWPGDLFEISQAPLPLSETIRRYQAGFQQIEELGRQIQKEREKYEKDLSQALQEIQKISDAGGPPSAQDLDQAREKRDHGWRLLKKQWLETQDVSQESRAYDPQLLLPDAYEKNVIQADAIADRLRTEADRAAHFSALKLQAEDLKKNLKDLAGKEADLKARQDALNLQWIEVWTPCSILPLFPAEMLAWLDGFEKLSFRVDEILKKQRELKDQSEKRSAMLRQLVAELKAVGQEKDFADDALAPALLFAESVLESLGRVQTRREKLLETRQEFERQIEKSRETLQLSREALGKWGLQWKEATRVFGIPGEIRPEEAGDLLETLQDCFKKIDDADDFKKRISGIDRDGADYAKELADLVEHIAPELSAESLEPSVTKLHAMLASARQDKAMLDKIAEEINASEEEIRLARSALTTLGGQMADLLKTAGCDRPEGLDEAIRRFSEFEKLNEKRIHVETLLAQIGEGATIEDLENQAREVDFDALPGRIDAIGREIEQELNPEIKGLSQIIGEEQRTLRQMHDSAGAAQAAEALEQVSARIRRLVDQYVRVKLAARILKDEIERYRAEHQDPVLKIASGHFSHLTLGSFSGLRTDVDDLLQPIIVGLRPDDSRVVVEGMSSGTRDQLYLALRLATLEWRLKTSESIPLIVDDILINFDDERSRATLKALSDLACKNQVILFTHHRQIVETARQIDGDIQVHEL